MFNSMPFVVRVLRNVLNQGEQYHVNEIILLVNESDAGKRLHPAFRGKNAQKLLDRLVRHGKIIRLTDAPDYYTLPPTKEE